MDNDRNHAVDLADKEWRSYVEPFLDMGRRRAEEMVGVENRQVRAEFFRLMMTGMSAASMGMLMADPDRPDFWPGWGPQHNFWVPNPDGVYYNCTINPAGVYKLAGYRGNAPVLDLQIGRSSLITRGVGGLASGGMKGVYANYSLHDLKVDDSGYYEVILSSKRPEGYTGDWWLLDPKAKDDPTAIYLVLRQFCYDWSTVKDSSISIERLDLTPNRPRTPVENIEANLKQFSIFVEAWTAFAQEWMKRYEDMGLVNKMINEDLSHTAGISTQFYFEGFYDFDAETEALICETEVPDCGYWCIQTVDAFCASIDYIHNQTHVNGLTARMDTDGKLRCVVSAKDPGVPNWLDTVGYEKGMVFGRWKDVRGMELFKPGEAKIVPAPTLTKVKLADLRNHLPADTPMVTPEEREKALRLRRKLYQMRKRW